MAGGGESIILGGVEVVKTFFIVGDQIQLHFLPFQDSFIFFLLPPPQKKKEMTLGLGGGL